MSVFLSESTNNLPDSRMCQNVAKKDCILFAVIFVKEEPFVTKNSKIEKREEMREI